MKFCLLNESTNEYSKILSSLLNSSKLTYSYNAIFMLVQTNTHLELRKLDEPKLGGIFVNFLSDEIKYRCQFLKKRNNEAIVKAVGIKSNYLPDIIDYTAGFGRDAFILASLGCRVRMFERHPIIKALLEDGLRRGYENNEIGGWLRERLILIDDDMSSSRRLMEEDLNIQSDVIYLDPMFPSRKKSAMVKKDMRILQLLVGYDKDSNILLKSAFQLAKKRIVVKRYRYANPLFNIARNSIITSKKHRFDIYLPINKLY